MKKLFFTAIFIMAVTFVFGQSFEKGNLVGIHVAELKLKPGVTEDQAVAFVLEKLIPAWEENSGTKEFLMRGVRGKYAGKYATLTVFKDEKHRDKYWANTSEAAEVQKRTQDAMKDLTEEADKLWYPMEPIYNDYLIYAGKGIEIKKGVIIGLHNQSLKLNQGSTEQQYLDYCAENVLPAVKSYMPTLGVNISKSIRGADSTKLGTFYFFPDQSVRDLLFDKDDNQTQYFKDYWIKYQDIYDGWSKIGSTEDTYTDWIVL